MTSATLIDNIPPASPPPDPADGGSVPNKINMADVIIAAAAAKTVKLKTAGDIGSSKSYSISSATEDVPPPTNDDVAERLVKRLLILCQRGEWDIAGENLKVVGD